MDNFSFVIRSRNEAQWIGHAIQSVVDQFGSKTQIIVVDDNSTDDTQEVVQLFNKRFFNIEMLHLDKDTYTPGKSLNMGIGATAAGENKIVGILSAHCEIRKIDPEGVKKYFDEDPKVFGIMGRQIPIYRGKKINPRYIWENFLIEENVTNPMEQLGHEKRYFFHNAFSFIKRDIWEACPFDEDLAGKEDRYWAGKLVEQDYKFMMVQEYFCHHFWTPNGATWRGMG